MFATQIIQDEIHLSELCCERMGEAGNKACLRGVCGDDGGRGGRVSRLKNLSYETLCEFGFAISVLALFGKCICNSRRKLDLYYRNRHRSQREEWLFQKP